MHGIISTLVFGEDVLTTLPNIRGPLTAEERFKGLSTAIVVLGRDAGATQAQQTDIIRQVKAMRHVHGHLDATVLIARWDQFSFWNRMLAKALPSDIGVEVHLLDDRFPGWLEVRRYDRPGSISGAAVTLVIPTCVLMADGSIPDGLFAGDLEKVDTLYLLDPPKSRLGAGSLLHRALLFLKRFGSLRQLYISSTLIKSNDDDAEVTSTLSRYHLYSRNHLEV